MNEFSDIWKSYLKGEPLSKVITESHHAEGDDENEDINEEEYEYVYIDEDGNEIDNYQEEGTDGSTSDLTDREKFKLAAHAAKQGKGPLADKPKVKNTKNTEISKESDQPDDEDLEVAEESDDEDEQDLQVAEEQTFEPCDHCEQPDKCREAGECLKGQSTSEADTPETENLQESLHLLRQENARLKEDLTFVVRKLRSAGLLED